MAGGGFHKTGETKRIGVLDPTTSAPPPRSVPDPYQDWGREVEAPPPPPSLPATHEGDL